MNLFKNFINNPWRLTILVFKLCFNVIQLFFKAFAVEHMSYALETKVLSVPQFQSFGEKDFQFMNESVFVFLR